MTLFFLLPLARLYKRLRKHPKHFARIVLIFLLVFHWLFVAWPQVYNFPPSIRKAKAVIAYEQEGFRFRNDNGSETTATWLAAQDTNITQPLSTNTRLRMLVNATDDPATQQFQLEYKKSTDTGYRKIGPAPATATPVVESRSTGASTAVDTTSHSITMPSGITAGDLLLIVFSADNAPDSRIDDGGWVKLDQAVNGAIVHGSIFYKIAEGSDTATVTTPSGEQTSHVVFRISGAGIPYSASANGSSTNSDPPNLDTGTSRNYLWIATRSGDSTVVATAAPSGYGNLQTQAAAGTGGASTNTAELSATGSSENPGTFTSTTEQWVSFTIAVPPSNTNYGLTSVSPQNAGTTSLSIAYPTSVAVGDMLVMAIANKHPNNAPSTPTGWTALSNNQGSGGNGTDGVDTGNIYGTIFTRVADGTETGNVSVTITSGNAAAGRIFNFKNSSGKIWATPVLANGSDNTPDTSWSVTAGSDPGVTAGDIVFVMSASNIDTLGYTGHTVTSASVTYTMQQEQSEFQTSNGNDLELITSTHYASSGTSTGAPVYTMTATGSTANSPAGASVFLRLRQTDAPIQLSASSNITASGESTTAQLTAPSGKTTSDFVTGRMQDDENPADTIDITNNDYTELEWSLIATTTATNGDIYQFRVTRVGTALDTYTITPQWTIGTADPTFTLSSYRWYVDNDSENVSDPWGSLDIAENTTITIVPTTNNPPAPATELRLRVALTVGTANLSATSKQFKLQYKAGTDASCTSGSWSDLGAGGSGSIWRFATSSVTDGTTLTVAKLTVSDIREVYAKANPTATNPNSATVGQDIEYDFHLQHNSAVDATTYSFRVIASDNSPLSAYTYCPTLVTAAGPANLMRHGNVFSENIEKGFTW